MKAIGHVQCAFQLNFKMESVTQVFIGYEFVLLKLMFIRVFYTKRGNGLT